MITSHNESQSRRQSRLNRSLVSGIASKAVIILATIGQTSLISQEYSPGEYGLVVTLAALSGFIAVLDFGLPQSILNLCPPIIRSGRNDVASSIVNSTFSSLAALSLAFFLLILFASWFLADWLSVFLKIDEEFVLIAASCMCVSLLSLPFRSFQKVLSCEQLDYIVDLHNCVGVILCFIAVGIQVHLKVSAAYIALVISFSIHLGSYFTAIYIIGRRSWYDFKLVLPRLNENFALFKVSSAFFLLQLLTLLGNNFDILIVSYLLGAEQVAKYDIAKKLFTYATVSQFFIAPLWPAIADALSHRDFSWIRRRVVVSVVFLTALTVFTSSTLIFVYPLLVKTFFSQALVLDQYSLFGFALWTLIIPLGGIASVVLNSSSLIFIQVKLVFFAACVSFAMQVFLTKWAGISGPPLFMLLSYVVLYVFPAYRTLFKVLESGSEGKHVRI